MTTPQNMKLYFEEHGAGAPLVLLHGGGSTIQTTFGAVLPRLAAKFHVIAPEQQGHGHTPDSARPFSFEAQADDTAELLTELRVRRAHVLGFSSGGMLALQLAVRHPELVQRVVVCSGFYAHEGLAPALREGFKHASAANMPAALREAYLAAQPNPDLEKFVQKSVAMMTTFRDLPEASLRALEVLVMAGDQDVVLPEHGARLARLARYGELAIFPATGHGAYLGTLEAGPPRHVDFALALIEEFLSRQSPAETPTQRR